MPLESVPILIFNFHTEV